LYNPDGTQLAEHEYREVGDEMVAAGVIPSYHLSLIDRGNIKIWFDNEQKQSFTYVGDGSRHIVVNPGMGLDAAHAHHTKVAGEIADGEVVLATPTLGWIDGQAGGGVDMKYNSRSDDVIYLGSASGQYTGYANNADGGGTGLWLSPEAVATAGACTRSDRAGTYYTVTDPNATVRDIRHSELFTPGSSISYALVGNSVFAESSRDDFIPATVHTTDGSVDALYVYDPSWMKLEIVRTMINSEKALGHDAISCSSLRRTLYYIK